MFLVFWRITLRRFSSTISLFRWNNTAVFSGKDNTWTFSEPFWQQLPYKTVGIEPKSSVFYKYSSTKLSKKESNLRLWKIQWFSINYALIFLVDIGGFEPPTAPLSGVCSTNWAKHPWRCRQDSNLQRFSTSTVFKTASSPTQTCSNLTLAE